jgi:dinuclear metal center YbgI/SA1388 family protein
MLTLKELRQHLQRLYPENGIADYAPNGLQVEGKQEVLRVATAVTSSLSTIRAAADLHADALIVHHGLFWQKDSYIIEGAKQLKLSLLLKHGISLFGYHLPMDLHPDIGNNWKAAKEMGWKDCSPFGWMNGVPIGVKGRLESCTPQQFRQRLEEYYQHPAACALGGPGQVKTAALISGGAHKSLLEASREGIDAFVTGSFDEPAWHQAFEEGVHFYALGHSATERVGPRALAAHLQQALQVPCDFIDTENPF